MRRILLLSLLLAGCAGCSLFTEGEPSEEVSSGNLLLRTDQRVYLAQQERGEPRPRYGFELLVRFVNRTEQLLYLDRCMPDSPHPQYGVELVDPQDDWGAAYNPVWPCVGHRHHIAVAPGATRSDVLHISGPNGWSSFEDEYLGVLEGQFRLNYRVRSCQEETDCAGLDTLLSSNVFVVQLAQ